MAGNQGDNLKDKEQKSIILECWLIHIITIQQVLKCGLLPAFRLAKRDLMDLCLHLVIFKQLILFFLVYCHSDRQDRGSSVGKRPKNSRLHSKICLR